MQLEPNLDGQRFGFLPFRVELHLHDPDCTRMRTAA